MKIFLIVFFKIKQFNHNEKIILVYHGRFRNGKL